jgi:hypothetical protein
MIGGCQTGSGAASNSQAIGRRRGCGAPLVGAPRHSGRDPQAIRLRRLLLSFYAANHASAPEVSTTANDTRPARSAAKLSPASSSVAVGSRTWVDAEVVALGSQNGPHRPQNSFADEGPEPPQRRPPRPKGGRRLGRALAFACFGGRTTSAAAGFGRSV